jgi:fused signal recognition particle receptor
METKDPFDLLMNIGSSPEGWFLVGGPFAILILIAVIYAVIIAGKRRRERADLEKEMTLEESHPPTPTEKSAAAPEEVFVAAEEETAKTTVATDIAEIRHTDAASWLQRLKGGLAKTRDSFKTSLGSIFSQRQKLSEDLLEQLHEVLYRADIGVKTADKLVAHVRESNASAESVDWPQIRASLSEKAKAILEKPQTPFSFLDQAGDQSSPVPSPYVILVVGVNGVGKTTTIGKLAAHFIAQDKTVLLAAADTFRAAAIDQLQVWGQRLGVEVIKHQAGSDPAAVAYDGVKAAKARAIDVLLIDTAGRLHSKNELMDELGKINRTIGKDLPGAPHETWLVIDATTGQNAAMQVKAFREVVKLSGLVVTKLDGTAKGGVLIGIADEYQLPIRYIGVGEKAADLRAFDAGDYAESLF